MIRFAVALILVLSVVAQSWAARDFTKNTGNYMGLGVGAVGTLLNGAAQISVHAIVTQDTRAAITTLDDRVVTILNNGTTTSALILNLPFDGASVKARIGARSGSGDALQSLVGAAALTLGTEYAVGGVVDISGDTLTVYVNGAVDAGPTGVTFANATYTHATPTVNDAIGSNGAAPPADTNPQFDGRISEVGIWAGDIGAAGFAQLAARVPPSKVRPDLLRGYWPLYGGGSSEPDVWRGSNGTITGTVAGATHPRMFGVRRPHP